MSLELVDLGFEYRSDKQVRLIFDGATATFLPGNFYALMGPSGSGKTTFFRLVARELQPTAGRIQISGRDLKTIPPEELRSSIICRIFQEYLLIPFLTPLENLLLAREIAVGHSDKADHKRALNLLERVGMGEYASRVVESLSGGEQQRVAIARALMGSASVLLADEPTGALDSENTEQIALLLADLAHTEGMVIVAGTHDNGFADHADSIVRIRENKLVAE
uniref:ABC transporter ATP-binding protein n=1 Tax=Vaginimicrobium propionicum TaxID=1871034 RepID=UPI0009709FD6|nr:ATP-binding cassette domain-containing protein [Vaginimicrobium propionicum]